MFPTRSNTPQFNHKPENQPEKLKHLSVTKPHPQRNMVAARNAIPYSICTHARRERHTQTGRRPDSLIVSGDQETGVTEPGQVVRIRRTEL